MDNSIIIRVKRPEGYSDVHHELVTQDFLATHDNGAWEYESTEDARAAAPAIDAGSEREAFEVLMRERGEDYLHRRDVPGCEKYGEYCRQNVQDQWEIWQARATSSATDNAAVGGVKGEQL